MSLRFMLGVAVGAVGGYAVGRVIEARAHGVPLDVAFSRLGVSVMELRKSLTDAKDAASRAVGRVRRAQPVSTQPSPSLDDASYAEFQEI